MNNTIIIGFNNNTKTFELPKTIIQSYPNSILSLYEAAETNEKIIIEDMTYEQFQSIYDVITKKTKQWLVSSDILKFMDKYGLVDDVLLTIHNNINIKTNEKLLRLDKFLNGDEILLSAKYYYQYEKYKILFENNKNIMPVQVAYDRGGRILCINIFDSIPIYCFYHEDNYHSLITGDIINKPYQIEYLPINNKMDINLLRYHILLENLKCKICKQCDNCIQLNTLNMKCCKLCSNCQRKYPDIYWINNNSEEQFEAHYTKYSGNINIESSIYTKDNHLYLSFIESLVNNIDTKNYTFNVVKSNKKNTIYWDKITPLIFTDNIPDSLAKIINILIDTEEDEIYRYNDNDYNVCYGFINITNILK